MNEVCVEEREKRARAKLFQPRGVAGRDLVSTASLSVESLPQICNPAWHGPQAARKRPSRAGLQGDLKSEPLNACIVIATVRVPGCRRPSPGGWKIEKISIYYVGIYHIVQMLDGIDRGPRYEHSLSNPCTDHTFTGYSLCATTSYKASEESDLENTTFSSTQKTTRRQS